MPTSSDIDELLDFARRVASDAGCASLVTVDEAGHPSSRPVRTFPSDDQLSKISIPTHPDSRKTRHVAANAHVLLAYVDEPSRSYVTVIGNARLNDEPEDKRRLWREPFLAFWPDGPDSDDYLLIDVTPRRLELRSYTLGVAADPTTWKPVHLERGAADRWRRVE